VPPPDAPEAPEERAFDYARTVALSDGVFAIALTLLVLNISLPHLAPGHEGDLGARLLDRGDELRSYAISFAVIGLLWVRHHTFFRGLARIDTRITMLNLVYLGLVAFLPYPTRVLGTYGDEPAAVVLYAGTVALVSFMAGATRVYAMQAGLVTEPGLSRLESREHWLVAPSIFLLSIPIAFVSTTAAIVSWLLLALAPRLRRGIHR
jgi:uncharacterized membrane protein